MLRPAFVIKVPYIEYDVTYQLEFIIEFWGLAGKASYGAHREVKERCYRSARVNLIGIEPDDLLGNAYQQIIETAIMQRIWQDSPHSNFSISPLID